MSVPLRFDTDPHEEIIAPGEESNKGLDQVSHFSFIFLIPFIEFVRTGLLKPQVNGARHPDINSNHRLTR